MLRFNFAASAALFVGVALAIGFSGCSDSSTPAPNDAAAASAPATPPSPPAKRPAPPPAPPSEALDSPPAIATDAGQSNAATAAQAQPTAKTAAERTYPPQMLPDATTDIPAWAGKDKDEPFDVKKFLESRAPPADNAAPLYFEAMAEICHNMDFVYPPEQWQERLPKVKAIENDLNKLAPNYEQLKSGPPSLSDIESLLERAKPAFDKLDNAQQKTKCIFVERLDLEALLVAASSAERIRRLNLLRILHASMKDNFAEAEHAIACTLRFARDMHPRESGETQLTSMQMEIDLFKAINDFTLNQKNLTANNCDRLLDLLIEHGKDPISVLKEGLYMDYISCRNRIDDLQYGRMTQEDLINSVKKQNASNQTIEDLNKGFQQIDWRIELTGFNRLYSLILQSVDRPYYEMTPSQLQEQIKSKVRIENLHLTWIFIPIIDELQENYALKQAKLASIICMIAVRKYEITHGKLPPNLSTAIAGTVLKEIPIDPFTGKPMRYESDGKGFKILYGSEPKNPFESGN